MTKLEICAIEQKSAWILCTKVNPFKVSSRLLKGLEAPLLSVGFPQSSLDKFSAGLVTCPVLSVLVVVSSLGSWEESKVR